MNSAVTTSDVANDGSVSTERQLSSPTYRIGPSRSQRCRLSQSDDQHRQQQEGDDAEQAGGQQRIAQRCRWAMTRRSPGPARRKSTESLKRARRGRTTVLAVTAPRQVDADFLALPRHELADAALSAAVAAGASHADLRIHRIINEVVQLRDGELETSVVDREVGLAVRVIVDGTWGFASHAELDAGVAAETARRAVQVARDPGAAQRRDDRAGARTGVRRRQLGVRLPDRPVRDRGGGQDRPCSPSTPGGCWPPTASTTSRPACMRSRSRRSTPTRSARRSPNSGCGCSRRWRRWPWTPRREPSRPCARWRRRPRGAGRPSTATTCGTGPGNWRSCRRCSPRRPRRPA